MRKNIIILSIILPLRLWLVGLVCISSFIINSFPQNYKDTIDEITKPQRDSVDKIISSDKMHDLKRAVNAGRVLSITGSTCYFTGIALNYAQFAYEFHYGSFIPGATHEIGEFAFPLKLLGPPLACGGANHATRHYKNNTQSNVTSFNSWRLYGIGWLITIPSTIFGMIEALGGNDWAKVTFVILTISKDILWGASCIKSIVDVEKVNKRLKSVKASVAPLINCKGGVGLSFLVEF